ncbi:hypothetical protein HNY73_005591 [Argiope bruennichi]|uniref:Uncharacterized protein n=1 Tax=Argiope bruennichi TaxID=94029 RepID=A0A8T0FH44_ARGBR|nr:hypothetical protein HNY73_005591 [Argiope bruennichi]
MTYIQINQSSGLDLTYERKKISKENVKRLVEENIQPTEEKMAIKAVTALRNKGIAVDCLDEEGVPKLIQMIQGNQRLAETIQCKKPSTRLPRCIIYDIPNGIGDVELLEVLELTIEAPKDSMKLSFIIKGIRGLQSPGNLREAGL